ncbi:MAG: CopD family protein [Gammaproteobacteria bacterium]
MSVAIALHLLSTIVWVGGMFFALLVLRPASVDLETEDRLPLWGRTFGKFFPWIWTAVIVLLISGYWMIFGFWGGFARLPVYLHLMQAIGWLMILLFLHLWFAPYRRFKKALAADDLSEAARNLNQIRQLVTTNLVLGLINAIIGASGAYW